LLELFYISVAKNASCFNTWYLNNHHMEFPAQIIWFSVWVVRISYSYSKRLICLSKNNIWYQKLQFRCKVHTVFPSHSVSFIVWWTLKNRQDTFLCVPLLSSHCLFRQCIGPILNMKTVLRIYFNWIWKGCWECIVIGYKTGTGCYRTKLFVDPSPDTDTVIGITWTGDRRAIS
jgi:hypothetical protein